MRNALIIFQREALAALQNPGVYVVAGLFLFLVSSIETQWILQYAEWSTSRTTQERVDFTQTVVTGVFGAVSLLYVFVIPVVTMRAFAEEKRSGLHELWATWPVRDWELILGKFLGLAAVTLALDAFMIVYMAVFYMLPWPDVTVAVDSGVIVCCAIGLCLLSLAYVAFGLFASSLTENQVVAAIITFAGLFFFWMAHHVGGEATTLFGRACSALSIYLHFANFARGAVAAVDALYFVLFAVGWLFLTARVLELRRWRV